MSSRSAARIVKRRGTDVTLVAWSNMVHVALGAAETVAAEGIDVEVVDLRTIYPFDIETVLESVRRTGRALVAQEANLTGGLGAEIAARIGEELFPQLRAPVRRVAAPDVILPANTLLERALVPDETAVADAIRALMRT